MPRIAARTADTEELQKLYAGIERVYGRQLEPVSVTAHSETILDGYLAFERGMRKAGALDLKLKELANLKTATLIGCPFCIDIGSKESQDAGVTAEQVGALHEHETSAAFSDVERLVIDYAVAMSRTPLDSRRRAVRPATGRVLGRAACRADGDSRVGELSQPLQPRDGHQGARLRRERRLRASGSARLATSLPRSRAGRQEIHMTAPQIETTYDPSSDDPRITAAIGAQKRLEAAMMSADVAGAEALTAPDVVVHAPINMVVTRENVLGRAQRSNQLRQR
jgi:AhpD family alkylhydroperoxidase